MASHALVKQDEKSIKPRTDDKEHGFPLVVALSNYCFWCAFITRNCRDKNIAIISFYPFLLPD